jgi:hypothetical protein
MALLFVYLFVLLHMLTFQVQLVSFLAMLFSAICNRGVSVWVCVCVCVCVYVCVCVRARACFSQVRVWDTRRLKSPVTEASAGGGVWRVKVHPSPHLSRVVLCAAMHGGFAVLHRGPDGLFDATRTVTYKGGHTSLGYVCR